MDKKKKIIGISIIAGLILIGVIVGIVAIINSNSEGIKGTSKTIALYNKLNNKQTYSFKTTLDENNKMTYARKGDVAYIDTIYEGDESKFVIRDGNSYLLLDSEEIYYTYTDNEEDLNKIEETFEDLIDSDFKKGSEKINGKKYNYEEYNVTTNFMFKTSEDDEVTQDDEEDEATEEDDEATEDNDENNDEDSNEKTRFYYNSRNQLVYIKTIIGDYQELLEVEVSDKVDDKLFEIPSNYSEI